jgi:pimeloyl-ACP methyl ester carboxylesterase
MNFLVQQQPAFVAAAGPSSTPFDAAHPTAVFIHGAGNDHSVWRDVMPGIAAHGWNALAPDLPGHGATFANAKADIAAYADWVVNLLDNGAIARAALIGHSMGSLIALECARRHPTRVSHLVLIGTAVPMPVADKVLQAAQDAPEQAYDMVTRASFFAERNADGTWPPPTPIVSETRALLSRCRPGTLAADMAACNAFKMDATSLASITAPTTVLVAREDRMTAPAAGVAVAEAIPHARVVWLERVGHMMIREAPTDVAAAVINAIDRASQ